ncbi:GxxExxY protein [Sphingomonas yunnanensis]|uniref:GxxExxY protein n=1 Tax=Sphingomonas yunnanensis TaxID=310400 RepID=UPI001CA6E843|nr:GxxExxY protein [Sphingomonas yunnanensis]
MEPDVDRVSGRVIDAAIRIHRELGPGLLESVYGTALAAKLPRSAYQVETEVPVSLRFEDMRFDHAFRIDLLVEDRLVVEIKSVGRPTAAHAKQLLTYLRLTDRRVGLLINFGGATLGEGIRRLSTITALSAPLREQSSE